MSLASTTGTWVVSMRPLRCYAWSNSFGMLGSVPLGERITLSGAQRSRDLPHLLIDVVVPRSRGEGVELRLEVVALLSFERRRALFAPKRTVTCGAGGDRPDRIPDCNQRWWRIRYAAY